MPHPRISRSARVRESPRRGARRVILGPGTTPAKRSRRFSPLGTRHLNAEPATAPGVRAKRHRIPTEIAAGAPPRATFAGGVSV